MINGIEAPQFRPPEQYKPGDVLLSNEEITAKIRAIAPEIAKEYMGKRLLLIGVLLGGFCTAVALLQELHRAGLTDVELDAIEVESYGSETTSGQLKFLRDVKEDPKDRHVLVVDDVIDTGKSLESVTSRLKDRNPASIASFVLLKKEGINGVEATYTGFRIPNVWVQGYGMDSIKIGRGDPNIIIGPHKYQR